MSELARHGENAAGARVHPIDLAVGQEAAERSLAVPKEPLDRIGGEGPVGGHDDLAAHRVEMMLVHDTAVAAPGGAWAGATIPDRVIGPHGLHEARRRGLKAMVAPANG